MRNKEENVNIYEIYMKDISKYGTIDDIKAKEYLKMYRNGTAKEKRVAREKIVGGLQRFVLSIANNFIHKDNLLDILNEGNIGLIMAMDSYDMDSEVKFTTYARYWIRKNIMKYITVEEPIVTPNNAIKLATYVPKIKQEFWNKNLRQPTTEEIQELILEKHNLNFSNKSDFIPFQAMSIDEKYDEDEDGQEFMEKSAYTSKTATCNADSLTKVNDAKIIVDKVLSQLNERDAYIMRCLYGIDCEPKNMNNIGEEIGITCERVRQIAASSIEKLGKECINLVNAY